MAALSPHLHIRRRDRIGGLIHECAQVAYMDDLFGTHRYVGQASRLHQLAEACSTLRPVARSGVIYSDARLGEQLLDIVAELE